MDQHLFLKISGVLYVGLATNVLLTLTSLPLVLVLAFGDPTQGWLPLVLATIAAIPGVPAAFEVFRSYSDDASVSVVRTFAKTWWKALRKSLTIGAFAVGAIAILVIDIVWAWGQQIGAVAIPVFVIAAAIAAATALGTLVAVVERPEAKLRELAKAALYLMLRRWHLTALSFLGCAALIAIITQRPALGLGVALAPLLYLVWANTRNTLNPIRRKA